MGAFLIKVQPDADLYMMWTTFEDCPTWMGSREEALIELGLDMTVREHLSGAARAKTEVILQRCDELGTTSQTGRPLRGSWDDYKGLSFRNEGVLSRDNLVVLATRWLNQSNDLPDISDLLVPFEE